MAKNLTVKSFSRYRKSPMTGEQEIVVSIKCLETPSLESRSSWAFSAKKEPLVRRFMRAIDAGVMLQNLKIRTDDNGKRYLSFDLNFLTRQLNSELERRGF